MKLNERYIWWGIAYRYSQAEMGVGPGPLCKFFLDGFE